MSRTSSSCLPVHLQTRECSSGRKVRCRRAPVGCRGQTRRGGLSLSWIIGMCARQHTQSNRLEMTLVSLGGTKCHHQCPLEFRKKDEVGCGRGGGCHWPHSCAPAIVLTCIEVADPKLIAVVIAVFRYPWLNFVVAQIPEPPWPVRHHHDRNCNRTVVSKRKKEEYTKVLRLLATNAPTVGEETPMGCTPQLREEGQWGWQPHPWSSR